MKNLTDFIKESLTPKKYVDGLLINDENQLLILRRANYIKNFGGKWGVVGGSIEKNESSKDAILREIEEETGCKLTWNEEHEMKLLTSKVHSDGSSTDYWVIQLEINPEITISREHSKYEWIDINNINDDRKWLPDLYEVLEILKQPKINECDFATPLNTTGMGNIQPCDANGNGTEPLPVNKKIKYSKPFIIKKKRKKQITESNNDLSKILENIIYDEDFIDNNYSIFDEDSNDEELRIKLIDGYCMEVCMHISDYYEVNDIQYYLLDNKGNDFHYLMRYNDLWYDAYNFEGVDKLENLKFIELNKSYHKYDEGELHNHLHLISENEFDYKKAMELQNNK